MIEVEKITKPNQTFYFIKGTEILHREDGPAVITWDGSKMWYINNKLHRIDGPAIEWKSGTKEWLVNEKRHRVDGPAVMHSDGMVSWFLNDIWFKTKEDWFEALTEEQKEKALYSEYFIRG
jgi:hypothetical protein